jgi:hypothetical protein
MSKEIKPSLKKAKQEVKKATLVLTKDEYTNLHELVILPLEQAVDNQLNNDRLFFDISQNLISLFGLTPKYDILMLYREETQKAIMESKKITSDTFKNHYWKYVREFLANTKGFVFPKSESVDAIKKQAQREKAKELTGQDGKLYNLAEVSDEQLSSGFFGTKGKKAFLDRIDAKEKDNLKKQKKNISNFKDTFIPKMRELVNNEYDFAMWIDTNLNTLRGQFKKQS